MSQQTQPQAQAQPTQQGTQAQNQVQIDYEALGKTLDGRINASAESALKGILKSQYGLDGSELAEAVNAYKAQKAAASQEEVKKQQAIIDENAKLKSMIQNAEIDKAIAKLSNDAGVDQNQAQYLVSLIGRDGLIDSDGKVVEKTLKERFDKVLTGFPFFIGNNQQQGGAVAIIGANQSGANQSTTDAQLDAIFGIKR